MNKAHRLDEGSIPEAGVACAALMAAVQADAIDPSDVILLNITGGGIRRLQDDRGLYPVVPVWEVDRTIREEDWGALRLPIV